MSMSTTQPAIAADAKSATALQAMLASHKAALRVVDGARPAIAAGASAMVEAVERGARLHYAAAGSSGLMALADASELPGTFGIAQDQIAVHMAGGVPTNGVMPGDTEDDSSEGQRAAEQVGTGDVAIVVSASGTTPFAIAFAETARARQATVIGLANVEHSALLNLAHIAIALPTGAEFVEGSTRLGAGTAQKAALNMMSTLMGIQLGHVHEGLMVNLHADNIKLRRRSEDIVCRIADVSREDAQRALAQTGFNTKTAVLVAGGLTVAQAEALLDEHKGFLGACLAACSEKEKN